MLAFVGFRTQAGERLEKSVIFCRQKHRLVRMLSLLVLCVGIFAGCTFLKELIGLGPQRPHVTVKSIAVEGVSLHAVDLRLTLQVENPNSFELSLGTLSYTIDAVGMTIARGAYSETFKVPAKGVNQIRLPLVADPKNILRLVNEVMKARGADIDAVTVLNARFLTPVGSMDVSLKDQRPLSTALKI